VLLEPFLDPQGILAGQGEELYIKTTRDNMKVLKEELRRLNPDLAQLRVYVTMNPAIVEAARQGRQGAWSEGPATDRRIVAAMKAGRTMTVTGISSRGTRTVDTYDLTGVTAALKKIGELCKMR